MAAAYLKAPLRVAVKNCAQKKRYPDENSARAVGQQRLSVPNPDTHVLYAYCCPECGMWHLTRRAGGVPIRVQAEQAWQLYEQMKAEYLRQNPLASADEIEEAMKLAAHTNGL